MIEALLFNAPKISKVPVNGTVSLPSLSRRSVRLYSRAGVNPHIGFFEFKLFEGSKDLTQAADTRPVAEISAGAPSYVDAYDDPYLTIDNGITDWMSTAYLQANAEGMNFIQYNFAKEIAPTRWQILFEGSWFPATPQGVTLHMFVDGLWRDISGPDVPSDGAWGGRAWFNLSIPNGA